ncbi:MAG: hypothetical protein LBS01_05825 [Prevotellaceae bacterium]|nr:hypothetical protein [Prevotellaceae bacterium]
MNERKPFHIFRKFLNLVIQCKFFVLLSVVSILQVCFAHIFAQIENNDSGENSITVFISKDAQIFNNQQLSAGKDKTIRFVIEQHRALSGVQSKIYDHARKQKSEADAKAEKIHKEVVCNLFLPFNNATLSGGTVHITGILPPQNSSNKKLQKHIIKNKNNICFNALYIPIKRLSKNYYLFFSNNNATASAQGNLPPPAPRSVILQS